MCTLSELDQKNEEIKVQLKQVASNKNGITALKQLNPHNYSYDILLIYGEDDFEFGEVSIFQILLVLNWYIHSTEHCMVICIYLIHIYITFTPCNF